MTQRLASQSRLAVCPVSHTKQVLVHRLTFTLHFRGQSVPHKWNQVLQTFSHRRWLLNPAHWCSCSYSRSSRRLTGHQYIMRLKLAGRRWFFHRLAKLLYVTCECNVTLAVSVSLLTMLLFLLRWWFGIVVARLSPSTCPHRARLELGWVTICRFKSCLHCLGILSPIQVNSPWPSVSSLLLFSLPSAKRQWWGWDKISPFRLVF